MLNVAEGEPWTDGGWIRIGSKMSETRCCHGVATDERQSEIDGHQGTNWSTIIVESNALNMHDVKGSSDREHGNVCDRRNGKQRLSWEMEHIDEPLLT